MVQSLVQGGMVPPVTTQPHRAQTSRSGLSQPHGYQGPLSPCCHGERLSDRLRNHSPERCLEMALWGTIF